MKLIERSFPSEKQFEYFGDVIIVPLWAKYIATDESGVSHAFRSLPVLEHSVSGLSWGDGRSMQRVAVFYRNGVHPKDTLREVK